MSTSTKAGGMFGEQRTTSIGGSTAAKTDPIESVFRPTEIQEEFLHDTHDQVLLSGSFGAGKSRIGSEKGYKLNVKYAGNRGLIVRKAFTDLRESVIEQTLLDEVIPESHIVEHNRGQHYIEHLTGTTDPSGDPVTSTIHYHGLDSGRQTGDDNLPRKIGSMEFGWIFADEGTELSKGEWAQLLGRLRYTGQRQNGVWYRVPKQQIFTATNPDGPSHWMYDTFFRNPADDTNYYEMTLHDNPGVDEAYAQRLENNLSGVLYERYVEGKWVGSEGIIYDEYKPEEHLIHPDDLPGWTVHRESEFDKTGEKCYWAEPPADWRIYRSIDFGYTNPFVCQWWARSPDDKLVLFREIYKSQTRISVHADEIERLSPDGRHITKSIADHDAEGREQLNSNGISTVNADKSVGDGIEAVKSRLAFDDRGEASLYFMEGARVHQPDPQLIIQNEQGDPVPLKTIDEITGYIWDEDADDDEPVKEEDHGMDAMRYLVYTLDGGIDISAEERERIKNLTEGL